MGVQGHSIKDTAKILGFDRSVVSDMCDRGELKWYPNLTTEGKRSRLHKRIPEWAIEEWQRRNIITSKEDLKQAVDRRRNPSKRREV